MALFPPNVERRREMCLAWVSPRPFATGNAARRGKVPQRRRFDGDEDELTLWIRPRSQVAGSDRMGERHGIYPMSSVRDLLFCYRCSVLSSGYGRRMMPRMIWGCDVPDLTSPTIPDRTIRFKVTVAVGKSRRSSNQNPNCGASLQEPLARRDPASTLWDQNRVTRHPTFP